MLESELYDSENSDHAGGGRAAGELNPPAPSVPAAVFQPPPVLFPQPARQLGSGGGFPGALQTGEQHHLRWLHVEGEAGLGFAQHRGQLAMQDADEGLARRQAARDLGAQGLRSDAVDEALDDR